MLRRIRQLNRDDIGKKVRFTWSSYGKDREATGILVDFRYERRTVVVNFRDNRTRYIPITTTGPYVETHNPN